MSGKDYHRGLYDNKAYRGPFPVTNILGTQVKVWENGRWVWKPNK